VLHLEGGRTWEKMECGQCPTLARGLREMGEGQAGKERAGMHLPGGGRAFCNSKVAYLLFRTSLARSQHTEELPRMFR